MITRAKCNAVGYNYKEKPPYIGVGRPRKKGNRVKLWKFDCCFSKFKPVEVMVNNETKIVQCLTRTFLWGKGEYIKLKFVWVIDGEKRFILVSTHLGLSVKQIIESYHRRFKIEMQFKDLKHTIGGFAYRFWSKHCPELHRFQPAQFNPLDQIKDLRVQETMTKSLKAIEGYVMMACIALGLVQMMALQYGSKLRFTSFLYLRTRTSDIPSEQTMTAIFG